MSAVEMNAFSRDGGKVAIVMGRLGNLYEPKGDSERAIEWYTRMIDRWERADDILQPRVEEARRRIGTLLDTSTREATQALTVSPGAGCPEQPIVVSRLATRFLTS